MSKKGLNETQKAFCREYVKCRNATKAAKLAGYSEKSAYSQGQRLLKGDEIRAYLRDLMAPALKKHEITVDRWAEEVAALAFMKADQVIADIQQDSVTLKPWSEIDGRLVSGAKMGPHGVEVRLREKEKGLEMMGKYLGVFSENINVRGAVPMIIADEQGKPLMNLGLGDEKADSSEDPPETA